MRKTYSAPLRIWHWMNAAVVTGLLGTFFLRETFLNGKANAAAITAKLSTMGLELTTEQARAAAKAVRAPMWEWHIILGVALGVLLLIRIAILVRDKGFGFEDEGSIHMKAVHWGYRGLYLILLFMAVSGVMMHWSKALGVPHSLAESLEEIHHLAAWAIVYFVPLHIAGVIVAEFKDQKNLVSKMISG